MTKNMEFTYRLLNNSSDINHNLITTHGLKVFTEGVEGYDPSTFTLVLGGGATESTPDLNYLESYLCHISSNDIIYIGHQFYYLDDDRNYGIVEKKYHATLPKGATKNGITEFAIINQSTYDPNTPKYVTSHSLNKVNDIITPFYLDDDVSTIIEITFRKMITTNPTTSIISNTHQPDSSYEITQYPIGVNNETCWDILNAPRTLTNMTLSTGFITDEFSLVITDPNYLPQYQTQLTDYSTITHREGVNETHSSAIVGLRETELDIKIYGALIYTQGFGSWLLKIHPPIPKKANECFKLNLEFNTKVG